MSEERASNEDSAEMRRRKLIEAARRQVEGVERRAETEPASPSRLPNGIGSVTSPLDNENDDSSLPHPDSFVGFKILREVHRGAQGVVYLAVQKSTKRKVAIKVMKEGPFAGPSDKARFDREVKLLGQLNHPNIVTIHGSDQALGCHYFVMDYISGQPLDLYMASEKRSVEETLRLFVKICSAVDAAHVRGIIHRDLKPGNIRIDSKGEPYILDFGLAKSASDAGTTMTTMTGRFLGTPQWASPEQAEGIPSNIDIRSDVYSLGVILFQMLTGKFPYRVTGSIQDVLYRIRKDEPDRPRKLRREINDEVETIVLKCLNKEQDRRYRTAGELEDDIKRYLTGDPIEAKRDSLMYMFRKQLRKYKPQPTIAASFLFLIVLSLATTVLWLRNAKQAQATEQHQREQAEEHAERLDHIRKKLEAVNSALDSRQEVTFKLYDDVKDFIAGSRLAGQSKIRAALSHTLGRNYRRVDHFDDAESHLKAAYDFRRETLGEEHEDTLDSANELARVYFKQGERRYNEANRLLRETLEICRRIISQDQPLILDVMSNLALVCKEQKKYDEARNLYEEVVEIRKDTIGEEHEDTLNSMNGLAGLYSHMGRLDDAARLHEVVLEIRRRVLDPNHRYTLNSMSNLGGVYTLQDRYDDAEKLLKEAIAGARLTLPPGHGNTGAYLRYYGRLLLRTGRFGEAEEALLESQAIMSGKYGEEDYQTIEILELLVELYKDWGKSAKAAEYSAMIPPSKRGEE